MFWLIYTLCQTSQTLSLLLKYVRPFDYWWNDIFNSALVHKINENFQIHDHHNKEKKLSHIAIYHTKVLWLHKYSITMLEFKWKDGTSSIVTELIPFHYKMLKLRCSSTGHTVFPLINALGVYLLFYLHLVGVFIRGRRLLNFSIKSYREREA